MACNSSWLASVPGYRQVTYANVQAQNGSRHDSVNLPSACPRLRVEILAVFDTWRTRAKSSISKKS